MCEGGNESECVRVSTSVHISEGSLRVIDKCMSGQTCA